MNDQRNGLGLVLVLISGNYKPIKYIKYCEKVIYKKREITVLVCVTVMVFKVAVELM